MLIAHHCAGPRHWEELEVELLKELAIQAGIALQQAELYQQAQKELIERRRVEAELRQSEARFRTSVENMLDCFGIYRAVRDDRGQIVAFRSEYVNDAAYFNNQMARDRQVGGGVCELLPGHPVSGLFEDCCLVLETEQALVKESSLYEDDCGQQRLVQALDIRIAKLGDGFVATWRDITDRQQAEIERANLLEKAQSATAEAERVNRIKDEFLAVLSHELRSPLNPILGWTQLLQTRRLDRTKTAEALTVIERNVKLQTQLIDDLLDVAKILRGKLNMDAAPVNLASVIESAIETVKTAAVAKSIRLEPVLLNIGQVCGDSTRLQQIMWNLLSNAIKFTPKGGEVEIRLEEINDMAHAIVTDTGKGIDPHFLPHIFESFRQEDVSITRKYGGLGLSLTIVRSLVEAHGGTIFAESKGEGQGARLTVCLPLLEAEPQISESDELPESEPDLTGIRVLTVDDGADTREYLTVFLTQYGAEVLSVASAAEALVSLESFQPDVLVSDIGMPEMDGYALLQQIRSLPASQGGQVPAIALTAYASEEDRQRALLCGFQNHISKPLDLKRLVQAVSDLARPNTKSIIAYAWKKPS
jgi:signal transduction histidine kinase/CheY-like chemotaxis protein